MFLPCFTIRNHLVNCIMHMHQSKQKMFEIKVNIISAFWNKLNFKLSYPLLSPLELAPWCISLLNPFISPQTLIFPKSALKTLHYICNTYDYSTEFIAKIKYLLSNLNSLGLERRTKARMMVHLLLLTSTSSPTSSTGKIVRACHRSR